MELVLCAVKDCSENAHVVIRVGKPRTPDAEKSSVAICGKCFTDLNLEDVDLEFNESVFDQPSEEGQVMEKEICAVADCENEAFITVAVGKVNDDTPAKDRKICKSCWDKLNFERVALRFKDTLK